MKICSLYAPFYLCYEGDDGGDPPVVPPPTPDDLPPSLRGKTTFTQDDLNMVLSEDRKKHKAQLDKQKQETERQIKTLESLTKNKALSDKEKEDLKQRIEELQNSMLTKEQLAAKEREKISKQYETTVQGLTVERDAWQSRFVKSTINTAIVSESVSAGAFDPDALIAILGPSARLAEEVDEEGKGLDIFTPKVKFQDTDREGKVVQLDLTVEQAIKRMKDMPKYGYLFKSTAAGGLGATPPTGKGGKLDPSKFTYEQWQKHRKEQGYSRKSNDQK